MPHQTLVFGMTVPELVTVIGVITASMLSFINAWKGKERAQAVDDVHTELVKRDNVANGKLEDIKVLANGTMHALKQKLAGVTSELEASTQQVLALTSTNDQLVREIGILKEMVRKSLLRTAPPDPRGPDGAGEPTL